MDGDLAFSADALGAAFKLLAEGRFAEGWPLYEARPPAPPAIKSPPEWLGGDVSGLRIAVCPEQGFGDQLMFARYLRPLQARGAEVCVAVGAANLVRIFEAAGFPTAQIYAGGTLRDVDGWAYFGSLPLKLGLSEPPPARWLPWPLKTGGGVGVVTSGSPTHANDANRSLPPAAAARLLQMGRDLSPGATGALSFADTAAIMADLDLVISVDTSVVHLAGAMGKPCWVLLPHTGLDWRWADGIRSPWYPDFRLFRQTAPGDWCGVLRAVEGALAQV
jgi:hypothetical protein